MTSLSETVSFRATSAEKALFETVAEHMGLPLATVVHDAVMAAAEAVRAEVGEDAWQEKRDRRAAAGRVLDGSVPIEVVRSLLGQAATDIETD